MDSQTLFLESVAELGTRTRPGSSEYDLLRGAFLLRQLLMDGHPLADAANTPRLKIRYRAATRSAYDDLVIADGATFFFAQDGLDPDMALPNSPIVDMTRDQLLGQMVAYVRPHEFTVRDVISYLAHVQGGVHRGAVRNERDAALEEATNSILVGGRPPVARSVEAIARVVLKGLQPLRAALSESGS